MTLRFENYQVGRNRTPLLTIDSEKDGVQFQPGLTLLVAPNGAGKSTLFQTLGGGLPPLAGKAFLGDQLWHAPRDAFFLSEYLAIPRFVYPREWIGYLSKKSPTPELAHWIQEFSLENKQRSFLGRMSQGERRKVGLLAAENSERSVLLLDEPLDGLDLWALRAVRKLFEKWTKENRIVIMVSHQASEVVDLAQNILILKEQRLKRAQVRQPGNFRDEILSFY